MNETLTASVRTAFRKDANGISYVTLTSSGRTGEEWENHLKETGKTLGPVVKSLLYSNGFAPFGKKGQKKVDLAILPGHLWEDDKRTWGGIIRAAHNHGMLTRPRSREVACLLADCLPDPDGVVASASNIIVLHDPYEHKNAGPVVLGANMQNGSLSAFRAHEEMRHNSTDYFAFVRWIRDSEDVDIRW